VPAGLIAKTSKFRTFLTPGTSKVVRVPLAARTNPCHALLASR